MAKKRSLWFNFITLLAITTAGSVFPITQVKELIPVTESNSTSPSAAAAVILPMSEFVSSVEDGDSGLRGIYVNDVMAVRVVQQPDDNAGFVSAINGVVTQFKLAEKFGTIGLLAHNFASGSLFSKIKQADMVMAIYGDGKVAQYKVTTIYQFQALTPESATSNFSDLSTGEKLTSTALFNKIYRHQSASNDGKTYLVLQTCIAKENESSWGRMFIVAEPVDQNS
jgi:hypothetical protein